MVAKQQAMITVLLVSLTPVATWGQGSEKPQRGVIPLAVNADGVLLDIVGIFEAADLKDDAIVLYSDPVDKSLAYGTLPSRASGKDDLVKGDLALEVTVGAGGTLKSVVAWQGASWSAVQALAPQAIVKNIRPLPDFDVVPESENPCDGEYVGSEWNFGCLFDYFECSVVTGTIACCDRGLWQFDHEVDVDDCQEYGVPLPG